jgi:hypothetical protein
MIPLGRDTAFPIEMAGTSPAMTESFEFEFTGVL